MTSWDRPVPLALVAAGAVMTFVAGLAALVLGLATAAPTLDGDVFTAVERDPGAAYPVAGGPPTDPSWHRQAECVDESGNSPRTWRDVSSGVSGTDVLDTFAAALPARGWRAGERWTLDGQPGGRSASGARFTKRISGHDVELVVYADIDDGVWLEARIPCQPAESRS